MAGHPWIFESELAPSPAPPGEPGAVRVLDPTGHPVGSGLWSPKSKIRVRLYSFREEPFGAELIAARLAAATARRGAATVCRLVWSEADGLPGLTVDRYGSAVVVQILHAALEAGRGALLDALRAFPWCRAVVERSSGAARKLEGLPDRDEVVWGEWEAEPLVVGGARFEIGPLTGHKTGAYLDQAENYREVAALARGRTVADCFANAGGFAIHCALAGAASVEAVDMSAEAVAAGKRNAGLNGARVEWHEANAFDWLRARERAGGRYGLIVLDPPSFARGRAGLEAALRGYREIHVRAFRMLEPGGILATFCCSHHVTAADFEEIARAAAGDARRQARMVRRLGQPSDHPVLLGMPESEYLKGLILEAV